MKMETRSGKDKWFDRSAWALMLFALVFFAGRILAS
jgi:hypothetical protein